MKKKVSLEFTETMRGFFHQFEGNGSFPYSKSIFQNAFVQGQNEKAQLDFTLTIKIDDIKTFINDPMLTAKAVGSIECPFLGGVLPVEKGVFNLFVPPESSNDFDASKEMHYTLYFRDSKGEPYTFYGYKEVEREDGLDVWDETTTLYTYIWKGHSEFSSEKKETIGVGILKIHLEDFIHQLGTFDSNSDDPCEEAEALMEFMGAFADNLWEAYAPFVFGTDRDRWNQHIYPIHTDQGVKNCKKEHIQFDTNDGLTLAFERYTKKESKDVVVLLHGLTTSTDMYIMPEHYNLVTYLHDHGYDDVWSLDWRGSGRFTYNLMPHRYDIDYIAKYDIPKAIEVLRSKVPEGTNIHVICHCVGSLGFMASLASGQVKGITSVISNSVSLNPKVTWQAGLKLIFGPEVLEYVMGYPYVSPKNPYFPGRGFGKWISWMERAIRSECKEPACHMVSFMWGWGFPAAYEHANLHPVTHRRLQDLFGGTSFHYYRHIRKMFLEGESVPYKRKGEFANLPESYFQNLHKVALPPTMLISGNKNHIFPESNKKTFQLIREKFPEQQVEYKEYPNYGHQDVFMGKNCDKDIFPSLVEFIDKHSAKGVESADRLSSHSNVHVGSFGRLRKTGS